MSFCIYLTHPEVQIDPAVPVPDWGLSDLGTKRSQAAADLEWAADIRHVVSSAERKAIETAEIFAERHGLSVSTVVATHENDRSATGFVPPEEFEDLANAFFAKPDQSIQGWERAMDAQARIVAAIKEFLAGIDPGEPVLFCGHGGVGTLLKCHLMGTPISRQHDQQGGGHWYRFDPSDLTACASGPLDWVRL